MRLRTPGIVGSPRRGRRPARLAAGLASVALMAGCPALAAVAAAPTAGAAAVSAVSTPVKVSARPAVPAGATAVGTLSSGTSITGDVALVPRDAAGLKAYATGASTPGSVEYHHYLSVDAFDAEFAPASATVKAVETTLEAGGLRITSVAGDGLLVGFAGDAAKAEKVFHTGIASYRLHSGRTAFANTAAAELPGSVASSVASVVGLNDLVTPEAAPESHSSKVSAATPKSAAVTAPAGSADACSAATETATSESGLTATQVAYAYGLDPLYTAGDLGQGQTIDILDLFGYSTSDITAFDDCYYGNAGSSVAANDAAVSVDNGAQPGNGTGGSVETELDVESVNAYAPHAKVDVYEAPNSDPGFLDDIAAMTASSAKIETISYGACEQEEQESEPGYADVENYLFEEAAAMGKTVFASSADDGSDTCSNDSGAPVSPVLSASDPASQPFVTGVGGTAIYAATDPASEDVWNDGAAGGAGGGGISYIWPEPAWQATTKVPGINDATTIASAEAVDDDGFCTDAYGSGTTCREVPDVSAQASPNTGGFPVYIDGGWTDYGGTSLASPTWAAILADIDSTASCTAEGGAGFISPKLYAIASVPAEYAASFDDVTVGNNDNFGAADGLYPATKGYDMASGLGGPKVTGADGAKGLAYYLCAAPPADPPTVTGLSTPALSSTAVSTGTTLTIDGNGFSPAGSSAVAAVSIGAVTVPTADVTVESDTAVSVAVPTDLLAEEVGNEGMTDGSGTYAVTVTVTGGGTSVPSARSTLVLYDSGAGGSTPVVDGTFPSAGVDAGGTPVTIYGSGFTGGTVQSVTFDGAAATDVVVQSADTITADTPELAASPSCVTGDDPTTGVCQVQVQVRFANGTTSAEATIPPEFSGTLADATTAAGLYPAATEYDYEPAPTITKATVEQTGVASEAGGVDASDLDITGTGLGALGFEWVNVGSYLNSSSEDYPPVSISSTSIVIPLPAQTPTEAALTVPVTVQTYGSPNEDPGVAFASVAPSRAASVVYAPTPTLISIARPAGQVRDLAGPTSGGTDLVIRGHGLDDAQYIYFEDLEYGFPATQYSFTLVSNSEITLVTPAALTGVYGIEVCGVSGCSGLSPQDFTYYLPGNPSLTSDTPKTGKAGTVVTIDGDNLGYVQAVYFGGTKARTFSQPSDFFESGDTYEVKATVPAGTAGQKIKIRVSTIESLATGFGKTIANNNVTFTYAKATKK